MGGAGKRIGGGCDGVSKTQTVSQLSAAAAMTNGSMSSSGNGTTSGSGGGGSNSAPYELSEEMKQREIEVMCRRYGGFTTAHRAASIIQARYRQYKMAKNFNRLCENTLAKRRSLNNAAQIFE